MAKKSVQSVQDEEMTILSSMEKIVELAEDSQLSERFYSKIKKYTDFIAKKCNLTPRQSVILSLWIEHEDSDDLRIDLSEYLGCRHIHILRYADEFEELVQKQLMEKSCFDNTFGYIVPNEVIQSLQKNHMFVPQPCTDLKITKFLDKIKELFDSQEEDGLKYEELKNKIKILFEHNKHLSFVTKFLSYKLNIEEKILLLKVVIQSIYYYEDDVKDSDLESVFDNHWVLQAMLESMRYGFSDLIKKNYLEFVNQEGLADRCHLRLCGNIKEELLSDITNVASQRNPTRGLLLHEQIVKKQLFFNQKDASTLAELTKLLQPKNFDKVLDRLSEQGMRKGFSCLFYGAPGTGKTETVLQLAKQTGRHIMQVDIANMKSCWVGESEKLIKKLFDDYRNYVRKSDVAPILLFNEADALFGSRMENTQFAIDKMENTIQNIILQEMEVLEGILIATTNLTKSLDKAFERRFIYKIEFSKPNLSTRKKIWHSMLPDLSENEAEQIAQKYQFTGGQIENISRKKLINYILNGKEVDFEKLCDYCEDEQIIDKTKRVGY